MLVVNILYVDYPLIIYVFKFIILLSLNIDCWYFCAYFVCEKH